MTDNPDGAQTPSDEHLLLARILERQRSDAARVQVDAVLESGIPVREKLERIEAIDDAFAASSGQRRDGRNSPNRSVQVHGAVTSEGSPATATRLAALTSLGIDAYAPPDREERRSIARHRAQVKAAPIVSGFFDYMFRQRRRIRVFQERTQFLRFTLFGLRLGMSPEAKDRLNEWIRREIPSLYDAVEEILREGWIVLTKREYNTIRVLFDVVSTLHDEGLPDITQGGRKKTGFGRYAAMERDLLVLHSIDRNGDLITAAFGRYAEVTHSESTFDSRKLSAAVRVLLDEERSPYSLAGYIRAVHIAVTGRFVTLDDLSVGESEALLSTTYFDCSPEVGNKIKEYLETVVTRTHVVSTRLNELARTALYAENGGDGADNGGEAGDDSNEAEDDGQAEDDGAPGDGETTVGNRVWRFAGIPEEESNVLVRVSFLIGAVERNISPLLDGMTPLSGGVGVAVFSEQCFEKEVSRIHRIAKELEKIRYDVPTFRIDRFFRIHRKTEEPSVRERQAVDLIEEFSSIMVQIGKRLTAFAGNRRDRAGSADTVLMPYAPITFGKGFVAPEIEQLIAGDSGFAGGSILDAVTETASIALQIGRYFEEKTIISELREASALRNELSGLEAAVQRIATTEVFEAVRERDLPSRET